MTRYLLLAASLAAICPPASGQIADIPDYCGGVWDGDGDAVMQVPYVCVDNEEIVVIGTRIGYSDYKTLSSPSSILTGSEIEARGADYVSDLLRAVPGLSVSSSGGAGQLTQIRMRGSEANHVLVLIDGIEVTNPSDGAFDFAGLSAANIARIEVLRGEQSALYGSDAIGGVINIITRKNRGNDARAKASLSAGSYGTVEGAVSVQIPTDFGGLSVSGSHFETDGFDISPIGDEKDGSETQSLNLSLSRAYLGDVTLSGTLGFSRLESEFDSFPQFGSSDDVLKRDTQSARIDAIFTALGLEHLLTSSDTQIETDSFGSQSFGQQSQANWAAKWSKGEHKLTGLVEAERQSYKLDASPKAKNDAQSLALDYQYIKNQFSLSASARQDFNSLFDDAATWRLGATYQLSGQNSGLRASVGSGVKNPTLIELFGFTPGDVFIAANDSPTPSFIGNSNLKPETSLGFNLGYWKKVYKGSISIDYFNSVLDNEIFTIFGAFDGPPNFNRLSADTVDNRSDKSRREGIELEGTWDLNNDISLGASVTLLRSEENGAQEQRRPELLASLTAQWQLTDQLGLNLAINHTAEQLDTDFGLFQTVTLDEFTLLSLSGRYRITDYIGVSLRGENLLDEQYQEVFGYESQGRSLYLGLSVGF